MDNTLYISADGFDREVDQDYLDYIDGFVNDYVKAYRDTDNLLYEDRPIFW